MDKTIILDFLRKHKSEFAEKYGVTKIGLFGSYARNEQSDESDIDVAIELKNDKKNIHTFLNLKRELEQSFGKTVDLGIESTLKPIAKKHISKEIIYV